MSVISIVEMFELLILLCVDMMSRRARRVSMYQIWLSFSNIQFNCQEFLRFIRVEILILKQARFNFWFSVQYLIVYLVDFYAIHANISTIFVQMHFANFLHIFLKYQWNFSDCTVYVHIIWKFVCFSCRICYDLQWNINKHL